MKLQDRICAAIFEQFFSPIHLHLTSLSGQTSRLESKVVQLQKDLSDLRAVKPAEQPKPRPANPVIAVDWDQIQGLNAAAFADEKERKEAMRFVDSE